MLYGRLCEVASIHTLSDTNRAYSHRIIHNNTPVLVYTNGVTLVAKWHHLCLF